MTAHLHCVGQLSVPWLQTSELLLWATVTPWLLSVYPNNSNTEKMQQKCAEQNAVKMHRTKGFFKWSTCKEHFPGIEFAYGIIGHCADFVSIQTS